MAMKKFFPFNLDLSASILYIEDNESNVMDFSNVQYTLPGWYFLTLKLYIDRNHLNFVLIDQELRSYITFCLNARKFYCTNKFLKITNSALMNIFFKQMIITYMR